MAKHILIVMSNPVSSDREAEYNEWYTTQHIRDVAGIPGYGAATRYVASPVQMSGNPPLHKYLAIYEIDAEDPTEAVKNLGEAVAGGKVPMSDAIDTQGVVTYIYTPMTERVTPRATSTASRR